MSCFQMEFITQFGLLLSPPTMVAKNSAWQDRQRTRQRPFGLLEAELMDRKDSNYVIIAFIQYSNSSYSICAFHGQ
jgi:hypothetical protein